MLTSRHSKTLMASLFMGICAFSFQNFSDVDDNATQDETMANMQIEDEVLQTSTDDMAAQQKEAAEHARLAEQERANAEIKLKRTKSRREAVEVEARVKITQDMARRQQALESRNRLATECTKLEKEISIIEQRIEKAEREAKIAREEARKSRATFDQLKQRRAQLLDVEKAKRVDRRKITGSINRMDRSVASVGQKEAVRVDSRQLPRVLPAKRAQ